MISKIEIKNFQINLILELLELILKFYSLRITFFLSNWWSQIFRIFFPTRIAKLGKFETKKNMLVGDWGGGQSNYSMPKFHKIIFYQIIFLQRKWR
jgi:hypothetical protein